MVEFELLELTEPNVKILITTTTNEDNQKWSAYMQTKTNVDFRYMFAEKRGDNEGSSYESFIEIVKANAAEYFDIFTQDDVESENRFWEELHKKNNKTTKTYEDGCRLASWRLDHLYTVRQLNDEDAIKEAEAELSGMAKLLASMYDKWIIDEDGDPSCIEVINDIVAAREARVNEKLEENKWLH